MRETGEKGTSIESTTNRDLILVHIFINSVSLLRLRSQNLIIVPLLIKTQFKKTFVYLNSIVFS
jgi:hypothetical protein